jgi:hypothetical protein
MNKLMKMNKEEKEEDEEMKTKLIVDGVLIDMVDIQNPMVTFFTKESNG